MYCTNCNAQIDDDSLFCTNCGTKIDRQNEEDAPTADETVILDEVTADDDAAQETTVIGAASAPQATTVMEEAVAAIPAGQSIPSSAFEPGGTRHMPPVQQAAAAPQKKGTNKKAAIIIAIVCVLVIAVAAIGYYSFTQYQEQQETHQAVPVEIAFSFTGDAAEQPIGVPLLIEGNDLDGNIVAQQILATPQGDGVELLAGFYTVTVVGDPVSTNGIVYRVQGSSTKQLEIPVPSDRSALPIAPDLDFSFTQVAADKVTDQQVDAIKSWMTTFGVSPDDIQHISGAIVNRRNAEVARATLEKEKEAALAANPTRIGTLNPTTQLTGTVCVGTFSGRGEASGSVWYLQLPKDLSIPLHDEADVSCDRVRLNPSFASYEGKVITISAKLSASTEKTYENACSPIAAQDATVVRVFE